MFVLCFIVRKKVFKIFTIETNEKLDPQANLDPRAITGSILVNDIKIKRQAEIGSKRPHGLRQKKKKKEDC